jgi:hypothetical protein
MEAGAALDEAMDALAQKNEDLTEDVQTFAKALDGLGEPLADAKAERRRLETIRAEYQSQRDHLLRKMAANESLPSDVKRTILEAAETGGRIVDALADVAATRRALADEDRPLGKPLSLEEDVTVKEEGSFFRGASLVKALEIPNNEDADVAKACAVVLDPHRPPAVMADVESVISALKAKTPSWRSCVAAANLAAHHNDVLDRRAELVPGLLRAACQRDAYYAQVFAGEALARLFRRGDAANINTVAPGAPLARLCKAVAERLMTEPRERHVAFLSLTQPQSPCAWRMFAARLARALVGGQRAQKLVREAALPLVRACAANCGPLRADASDDDHGRCFLPHCAAAVDVLARTHGSLFLERYEDRSLLGLVAVAAAPNLGSPDARTAVDVALQLRDRGEARAKGPEWSRFRDLAKEFIGRSPRHARGVDRGVVVGHCRAALPHLLVAACSIQDRAYLDDDIARCVDALAADLGDGRAGAALAVALLAAQTDSWSQRAARGLLPACCDLALCALEGLRHPPNEGLQQALDAIGDALCAWCDREDTRVGALAAVARLIRHVPHVITATSPHLVCWRRCAEAAERATKALSQEDANLCRDLAALWVASDASRCNQQDDEKAARACERLADRAVEGAGTPAARVSAKAVADLIAHGGFDVLTRILASDRDYPGEHEKHRRLHLVRAAHEAFAPLLLAARETLLPATTPAKAIAKEDPFRLQAGQLCERWVHSHDFRAALAVSSTALAEETCLLLDRVQGDNEHDPRSRATASGLVLIDCLFAAHKAVRKKNEEQEDDSDSDDDTDEDMGQAWNQAAQLVLASLPHCLESACDACPLGAAFHVLFDLGLAGHVGSAASEEAAKVLINLLGSERLVDDGRKSTRSATLQPDSAPILARHAAAVALLIFAESRRGRNAWLRDVCLHQGLPPLLQIMARDAPESAQPKKKRAAAAAENAVRAAAHLLSLAARAASGRPYLRKALVDFDPLFAPAEETEADLLSSLAALEDAAADRRELFRRRRKRIQDRQQQKVVSEQAAADADRAAAELIAEVEGEDEAKEKKKKRNKKKAKKKKAKRDSEEKAAPAPAPGRASPRLEEFTSYDDKDDDAAAVTPEDSADDVVVQAPAEIDSDDGDEADTPTADPVRAEPEEAADDPAAARRLAVQALEMGISAAADDIPEALAREMEAADAAAEVKAARRPAALARPDPTPARPAAPHPTPTFDDSQYTTALDAAALTPQQRADAEKIAREIESGNLRVGADGLLAAAPHPDYNARQEGQLLSRQPTLDKTDPTLEEYEAMRKAQLAQGPPGLAPPSAQSSPNGVEATSVSFDAEDDALDAALLDAGLANDLRTRDILRWEGIDAQSLRYLEMDDYVNLDLRMGARAKLRRWAASQRSEPIPEWLKCPLSSELFDDPVLLIVDSRTYERCRIEAWLARHGASPFTQAPARATDLVSNLAVRAAADAFRSGGLRAS